MKKRFFIGWATCLILVLATLPTHAKNGGRLGELKSLYEFLEFIEKERKKNVKSGYFKNHTLLGSWKETLKTTWNGHAATFKRTEFDLLFLPIYSFDMEVSYYDFEKTEIPSSPPIIDYRLPIVTPVYQEQKKETPIDLSNLLSFFQKTEKINGEFSEKGRIVPLDFFTRWGGKILLLFIGFIAFCYVKEE